MDALAAAIELDPTHVQRWSGARGELLERARASFDRMVEWDAPGLPAVERFTGVVWDHLDAGSLPADAQRRLLVPTAAMGLSTGLDPVPDHRIGFGASVPGLGRLDRWWTPHLTAALRAHAGSGTVVDLLPQEHAAAFDLGADRLVDSVVRVRFLSAGGRGAAGHAAKAVKGVAARVVLTDGLDALASLRWEGWRARRDGQDIEVVAGG